MKKPVFSYGQNHPTANEINLFSNIIFPFLTNLLSMAVIALIAVLGDQGRISYIYQELLWVVIILGVFFLITAYLIGKKRERVERAYRNLAASKSSLVIFILCFIAGIIVLFIVFSMIIPPFQIISPESHSIVGPSIPVSGNGAIPGTLVSVWVIDEKGRQYDQGQSINPTANGEWIIYSASIGRDADDQGKEFKIFAKTQNKEGKEISSKTIVVVRN